MKHLLSISFLSIVLLWSCEQEQKTVQFFAGGNCADCQSHIENSLTEVTGVVSATWNLETSLIEVVYRPGKVAPEALQEQVAKAGFETQFYPADEQARTQLPDCCQSMIDHQLKRVQPDLPPAH